MIDRHQRDPDPLNTLPEIAAARAVFEDFINRYEEHSAALIAWHESFGKEDANPKPTQILDIADAYRILDTITKMVERREKADNRNALSRDEFIRIVTEMGRMVNLYVEDEKIREKIKDAWSSIHVA